MVQKAFIPLINARQTVSKLYAEMINVVVFVLGETLNKSMKLTFY